MSSHLFGDIAPLLFSTYYERKGSFHPNKVKVVSTNCKSVLLPSPQSEPLLHLAEDPKFYVSAKPKAAGSSTSSANDYTVSWSQTNFQYRLANHNLLQWGLGYRVIFEVSQQKKKQKDPRKDTESYPSISLQLLDHTGEDARPPIDLSDFPSMIRFWQDYNRPEEFCLYDPTNILVVEITLQHIKVTKNGKVVFHTGHFLRTLDLEKPEFKAWSKPDEDGQNPVFTDGGYFCVKQLFDGHHITAKAWNMFTSQVTWLFSRLCHQYSRKSVFGIPCDTAALASQVLEAIDFYFIQPYLELGLTRDKYPHMYCDRPVLSELWQTLKETVEKIMADDPIVNVKSVMDNLQRTFYEIHRYKPDLVKQIQARFNSVEKGRCMLAPIGVSWLPFTNCVMEALSTSDCLQTINTDKQFEFLPFRTQNYCFNFDRTFMFRGLEGVHQRTHEVVAEQRHREDYHRMGSIKCWKEDKIIVCHEFHCRTELYTKLYWLDLAKLEEWANCEHGSSKCNHPIQSRKTNSGVKLMCTGNLCRKRWNCRMQGRCRMGYQKITGLFRTNGDKPFNSGHTFLETTIGNYLIDGSDPEKGECSTYSLSFVPSPEHSTDHESINLPLREFFFPLLNPDTCRFLRGSIHKSRTGCLFISIGVESLIDSPDQRTAGINLNLHLCLLHNKTSHFFQVLSVDCIDTSDTLSEGMIYSGQFWIEKKGRMFSCLFEERTYRLKVLSYFRGRFVPIATQNTHGKGSFSMGQAGYEIYQPRDIPTSKRLVFRRKTPTLGMEGPTYKFFQVGLRF